MTDIELKEMNSIKSFNGNSLQENYELAINAIKDVEVEGNKFDRSHSQFAWKHFVLDQFTRGRNIRQIFAEIENKKQALIDNKYIIMKKMAEIDIKKDELLEEKNQAKRKMLKIEIMELEETLDLAVKPIQGALKDVMTLYDVYNQVKKEMSERDFEGEEKYYWIKRLISQSMRDVRMTGHIHNGNQEALEQIGLNPLAVEKDIIEYLQEDYKNTSLDISKQNTFLEEKSKEYSKVTDISLILRGIEPMVTENALFKEDDM
jgi:hypothetical protein